MAERVMETSASPYSICGEPGCLTVSFTSPHNSLHRCSGVRSEDEAQAWIAELARTYAELDTASIAKARRRIGPSNSCRIKKGRASGSAA